MRKHKERGVLFSAPMVRALLDGRKTQTRRPVKLPQGYEFDGISTGGIWGEGSERMIGNVRARALDLGVEPLVLCSRPNGSTGERRVHCPYGAEGDRLWVRETFGYEPGTLEAERQLLYRATLQPPASWPTYRGAYDQWICWRPSIFMPRAASRLTLEIEHVRVQQLQEIRCHEISAEGVACPEHDFVGGFCVGECDSLRLAFARLWDSIHRQHAGQQYADNPLVWAISFRVVPQQQILNNTQPSEATT